MPIAWRRPDGTFFLTQIEDTLLERKRREGESTADAVLRIAREVFQPKTPVLTGLTPTLIRCADVPGGWNYQAGKVPGDRTRRYAWRLSGNVIVVDLTIPEPQKP